MSTPTPSRARPSEHRRDDLLDAAQELFTEKGVAATAVSEITSRAGVAKGTFYLYFASKDHVVAGLHERAITGMMRIVEEDLADLDSGDFYALADELTARIIDYWIDRRELFLAIREAGESIEIARLKSEYSQRVVAMLEAGVRFGIEAGVADVGDPRGAAEYIFYGCEGSTTAALIAEGPVDRDRLVASCQEAVRKIMRP